MRVVKYLLAAVVATGALGSISSNQSMADNLLTASISYDSFEGKYLDVLLDGSGGVEQFCFDVDGERTRNIHFIGFKTTGLGNQILIDMTSADGCVLLGSAAESFRVRPVMQVSAWFESPGSHSFTLELKSHDGAIVKKTVNGYVNIRPEARLYFLGQRPVGNKLVMQALYSGSRQDSIGVKSVCLHLSTSSNCLNLVDGLATFDITELSQGTNIFTLTVVDNFDNTNESSIEYVVPAITSPRIWLWEDPTPSLAKFNVDINENNYQNIESVCLYKAGEPLENFTPNKGNRTGHCVNGAFSAAGLDGNAVRFDIDVSNWRDGENTIGVQIKDIFGNASEIFNTQVNTAKARPSGLLGAAADTWLTTLHGSITQPGPIPSNKAVGWSIKLEEAVVCSGSLVPKHSESQEFSCALNKKQLSDGSHVFWLYATLEEGQEVPLKAVQISSQMLDKPNLRIGTITYAESSKVGKLAVRFQGEGPEIYLVKTECTLETGQVVSTTVVDNSGAMVCTFNPDVAPRGSHNLQIRAILLDGTELTGATKIKSNLKPIPRPSVTLTYDQQEWTGRITAKVTKKTGDIPLSRGTWYINGVAVKDIAVKQGSSSFNFDFSSMDYSNGPMKVAIVFPKEKVSVESIFKISLLPPPPPPPSIKWATAMNEVDQGQTATVAGVISSKGQLARSARIRFQEYGKNWGLWKDVSVSKSGFFTTSFTGQTNTRIQLSVPRAGRTPPAWATTSVTYKSRIVITTEKRTRVGQDVIFRVHVKPQREFVLRCNANAEVVSSNGNSRWLFENRYTTLKTDRSGFATMNLGAFEFPHTHVYFICSTSSPAVTTANGSSIANVY